MKKSGLTTVLFVFLLFLWNGIQGQTTQTQLDQVKLMQQMVGTWQTVLNKDTTLINEYQQYGNAFLQFSYFVIDGKKSLNYVDIFCYSPDEGKFKGFVTLTNGINATWIGSYKNEKEFSYINCKDFNPEIVYSKVESTLETPTSIIARTFSPSGVKIRESKDTKIK
jgi:hypothetical protein